ncbi:MAG: hypothetical protein ABSE49_16185 [Polyangiaceae bacterium]|jgi:hypothetical protein
MRLRLSRVLAVTPVAALALAACLSRPVTNASPDTNTNFTAVVHNEAIDQVDVLFVIDNSASMGDKVAYLTQAVPNLITRLVTPNCVDANGNVLGQSDSMGNGTCTTGKVEFPPVHDMHIGILSSSLGKRLSDTYAGGGGIICDPTQTVTVNGVTINNGNDDQAHLLNRSGAAETPLADAGTLNYLNWFPNNAKNMGKTPSAGAPPITDATTLITDFTSMLQGVGNYGCGIESQLESWYRFLVQPDPYASLSLDSNNHAQWTGVDTTILQQRAAFLRPDSLVAIIDMTDENDSEIDVRSYGGQGYLWMAQNFEPPRGTVGCAEDANDDGLTDPTTCNSCQLVSSSTSSSDASCMMGDYSSQNDWGFNANLRHVHMMQKYGIWPQFPIQRYVLGLTSKTIPDRNGEYPAGAQTYQGTTNLDCTNPLFASALPDGSDTSAATLCNLPPGPRTPDLIYYAHIGGVPFQLLQQDPTNPNSPPKETLAASDWTKILGNAPLNFDYTGIDPHMIESYQPRTGIATPSASGPPATPDPENGYDWITDQGTGHVLDVDREYACIFPITPRDCTNTSDPAVSYACDCPAVTTLTPQQLPPLCNPTTPTQQVAAKAYPTERELLLANLMGQQGFISSLCPIHVQPATGDNVLSDPLYGYNPAVNGIVDRLKVSLNNTCLPQKLTQDSAGNVPCLILLQLATQVGPGACANPGSACNNAQGLLGPGDVPMGATNGAPLTQDILNQFCQAQEAQYMGTAGAAGDPDTYPTCALQQLTADNNPSDFSNGSCAGSSQPGWCYVTGAAANGCPQEILFSNGQPPSGATVSLQCIEQSVNVLEGGTTGGE